MSFNDHLMEIFSICSRSFHTFYMNLYPSIFVTKLGTIIFSASLDETDSSLLKLRATPFSKKE